MAEANWYVVHTYSGYENKVKVDIEKSVENRNLQDQILEVSVPTQPVGSHAFCCLPTEHDAFHCLPMNTTHSVSSS